MFWTILIGAVATVAAVLFILELALTRAAASRELRRSRLALFLHPFNYADNDGEVDYRVDWDDFDDEEFGKFVGFLALSVFWPIFLVPRLIGLILYAHQTGSLKRVTRPAPPVRVQQPLELLPLEELVARRDAIAAGIRDQRVEYDRLQTLIRDRYIEQTAALEALVETDSELGDIVAELEDDDRPPPHPAARSHS